MNASGRARTLLLVLLAVARAGGAGAGALWWNGQGPHELVLAGVVEVQEVHVGSRLGGRVAEVLAAEGDEVAAGAPLVRFEVPRERARRDQLAARLAQAAALLERLEHGARPEELAAAEAAAGAARARLAALEGWTRPEELDQAEAEQEAARADLALAETTWRRMDALQHEKVASSQQADDARAARDASGARLRAAAARVALLKAGVRPDEIRQAREEARRAQAQLDLLKAGTRSEELAEARAKRDELRAALAEAEADLAEGEIRAPARARVEVLAVRKGDLLSPSRPVARLLLQEDLWVKVFCPEPDLGRIAVHDRVKVQVDSHPHQDFDGVVTQIAGESEFTPRNVQSLDERWNQVFSVKIHVTAPPELLKPGMAARARLPRRAE
ncbi:MAG: efflux RND transporter periplasmic adaptor subunit [Planctomycetes bacterium]|nr:efflux RND transporter periplasmic adaptor subunit [Planctomycetota bacterium]